jgi:hypothetical protein
MMKIYNQTKTIITSNKDLNILNDRGTLRRIKQQKYTSLFDEDITEDKWDEFIFKADPEFMKKFKNSNQLKNAYVNYLIPHTQEYIKNKKVYICEDVKNEINKVNEERDEFLSFLKSDLFEMETQHTINLKMLIELYKIENDNKITETNNAIMTKMKNYGYDYKFEGRMKADDFKAIKSSSMIELKTKYSRKQGIFIGIRYAAEKDDEEAEDIDDEKLMIHED